MIRNLPVAGGRQVKNEDLTHYIQAFTVQEQMFADLSYGTFIVHGVNFTVNGSNFDISSGVIYYDGELCIFQGATNVSLPHRLRKERVGINPRTFQNTEVKNTAESVRVIFDAAGPLQLQESTARASSRFFRQVAGNLRAPIDANNNNTSDVWKPILSDRIETVRRIPQVPDGNRYLQLGTIPIASTQASHFFFSGVDANDGVFAYIKLKRVNLGGTNNAVVETFFLEGSTAQNERPVFYTRRNDPESVFELWVKSPALILLDGEYTSGVVSLMAEDFTGNQDEFTFSTNFAWQSAVPSGLVESTGRYYITDDELVTATETEAGLTEIATQNEVDQGIVDNGFVVSPEKLRRTPSVVGSTSSVKLNITVLDIGDWNMDATPGINVPHGLTLSNIRNIDVLIRDDGNDTYTKNGSGVAVNSTNNLQIEAGTTNIFLSRTGAGFYDNVNYNQTSYNRGWITILHVVP